MITTGCHFVLLQHAIIISTKCGQEDAENYLQVHKDCFFQCSKSLKEHELHSFSYISSGIPDVTLITVMSLRLYNSGYSDYNLLHVINRAIRRH